VQQQTSWIQKPFLRAAQLFGLWTAIVILFTLQWYSYTRIHGFPFYFPQYLRWSMEEWYTWLIISPAVLWLAARYPIDPGRLFRSLPLHLIASLVCASLAVCVQAFIAHLIEPGMPSLKDCFMLFLSKAAAIDVATYWAITALAQTFHYYRENNSRQLRETRLERQLAQAQLQILQMQLHPHFLFNTLHAIGTLIREDPEAGEQMVLDLSSLLRIFLEQNHSPQISLRREMAFVEHYLNIQRVRFRDRLMIRSRIAPDVLDCSVPSLILQPIIENAIVHGVAKNPGADVIEIRSWRQQAELNIEISNSNSVLPGKVGPDRAGWGIGLSNTEQRLTQIYDGAATLSIRAQSPRGVVCRIAVPFARSVSEPSETEALLSL
jgi:two-component system, LytTR family, sensor kinase